MLLLPQYAVVLQFDCQHCSPDQQQTQHQLCRNSALMQLHKAEMEGKTKASCLPLHPHQDPVKVFGAKVSIIFGKKENSLQKGNFPGCYVDQEKLQAVYTPAIL